MAQAAEAPSPAVDWAEGLLVGVGADAQDQLDETRKQQVQKANETFKSQLDALTKDLGSSQSLQGAAQQLKTDIATGGPGNGAYWRIGGGAGL